MTVLDSPLHHRHQKCQIILWEGSVVSPSKVQRLQDSRQEVLKLFWWTYANTLYIVLVYFMYHQSVTTES